MCIRDSDGGDDYDDDDAVADDDDGFLHVRLISGR